MDYLTKPGKFLPPYPVIIKYYSSFIPAYLYIYIYCSTFPHPENGTNMFLGGIEATNNRDLLPGKLYTCTQIFNLIVLERSIINQTKKTVFCSCSLYL